MNSSIDVFFMEKVGGKHCSDCLYYIEQVGSQKRLQSQKVTVKCSVRKIGIILRSIEWRLQMQFPMAPTITHIWRKG